MSIYEIVSVERASGALPGDVQRVGSRYSDKRLTVGMAGILVHADNPDKALCTSPVQSVTPLTDELTQFRTANTTYTLREIKEANA